MNLNQFASKTNLLSKIEIEKVAFLTFFFLRHDGLEEFSLIDVRRGFQSLGLPLPNQSRLKDNLKKSKKFIQGSSKDTFRLHVREITVFDDLYPELNQKSEEIISLDTILPISLYLNTRGYIESLAKQINASYENNIFDGCAVLMRRLLEILLIQSYEHFGIANVIKDGDDNYRPLETIISDAKSNATLNLSRNTKAFIDIFRNLGNFSAHKIYYTCRRSYIQEVILDYRAAIEELLYKSGIKK